MTHLALTDVDVDRSHNRLLLGPKDEILATSEARTLLEAGEAERSALEEKRLERRQRALRREEEVSAQAAVAGPRKALIELKGVNVSYGRPSEGQEERKVLNEVDWTVKEGERWLLAGHNGKRTLRDSLNLTDRVSDVDDRLREKYPPRDHLGRPPAVFHRGRLLVWETARQASHRHS